MIRLPHHQAHVVRGRHDPPERILAGAAGRANCEARHDQAPQHRRENAGRTLHPDPGLATGTHGPALTTRATDGGCAVSFAAGRTGLRTSSPPQLGQHKPSLGEAHSRQKVHSKEQM
jgi:hypothetical protein